MKKVLALVLVAVMAIGMTAAASAVTAGKENVTGFNGWTLESGYGRLSYSATEVAAIVALGWSGLTTTTLIGTAPGGVNPVVGNQTVTYDGDVVPHDKIKDYINLFAFMFEWKDNTLPTNHYFIKDLDNNGTIDANEFFADRLSTLSAKDIRNSKMSVRTAVSEGSKAIDTVSIDNRNGRIEIKYVEEYVSTKELDFDFTVYLVIDGKRNSDEGLTFVGTLANPIQEIYENDDYAATEGGYVLEAMEFVPEIEVDLGNGVSIFTKLFKTKKYYGTASREPDEEADVVFAKYPDVDNVVILKTVGLNSTGDVVRLDTDYSDYWVYDVNMNYLGQSNGMLPYSTRYYLANRKLDIIEDEIGEGDAPTIDGENPETGGDGVVNNPNANPGTGR